MPTAEDPTERARDDLIEQALFNLTPYFLEGAGGDRARARNAAYEMLCAYPVHSMLELQLVTEIIAFSQSAIDDLRRAKAEPAMPEQQRTKLRARAVRLNAAEHRTVRLLQTVYNQRARKPAEARPEPKRQPPPGAALSPEAAAMLREMQEKVAQHRARDAAAASAPGVPVNPDQHRAAEPEARREAPRVAG
jgi:hypothetical protein